jgi:hypothetical protein
MLHRVAIPAPMLHRVAIRLQPRHLLSWHLDLLTGSTTIPALLLWPATTVHFNTRTEKQKQ